ncbi:TPA: restriction endonuclease subunit S [Streptococcus agalactiae]|nr:restriction endonuclease subunit S [Streptococcus agalactiae]
MITIKYIKKSVENFTFLIPNFNEQEAIGDFFQTLDNKLLKRKKN